MIEIIYTFFFFFLVIYYYYRNDKYDPKIGMAYIQKSDNFIYKNQNQSNLENKIAIVSSFLNYHINKIISFVKCLENVKFKGHIILFINRNIKLNFSYPIIHQIIVMEKYPYYSIYNKEFPIPNSIVIKAIPKNCHWNIKRYYLYFLWLKYYHILYSYFYFCDGRDVIFQLNPSMWNFGKGVHLTLQSNKVKIKNSNINVIWTREFKMKNSIYYQYVINGGTIFGSSKEVYIFISQMIFMLKTINMTCSNDQGSLIYFYYSHPHFHYPVYLDNQGYGYCLTLCDLRCDIVYIDYCNYKLLINESKIKNMDGTIPVILHGFERWKITKNITRKQEYNRYIKKYYPFYTT